MEHRDERNHTRGGSGDGVFIITATEGHELTAFALLMDSYTVTGEPAPGVFTVHAPDGVDRIHREHHSIESVKHNSTERAHASTDSNGDPVDGDGGGERHG